MASSSASDVKTVENRSFLFEIDLNEIPSSPSSENNHNHNQHNNTSISTPFQQAYDVVRECLGNPRPATGGPAELPSERRNEACVCGRTEAKGGVVVCDGCERWFHISCAGMRFRQACVLEDWACASCVKDGVGSKRWPLGFIYTASNGSKGGGVQLLDINALPPSDADGDGEGSGSDRMYAFDENLSSSSLAYPNTWNVVNEFELQRGISLIPHPVVPGFKGTMQHRLTMSRSFEEADLSSHQGGMLQGNANIKLRRKELARLSRTSHPAEKQEIYRSRGAGLFSEVSMEPSTFTVETNARIAEVGAAVKRGSESQQLNDVLPVQYEDFFVLRLGEIDLRPSYHIKDQIWPVGYQSSWHDRITGSIFMCDVLEGGGMGPIFKVTRFPCCMFLISNGSTILLRPTADSVKANDKLESDSFISPDSTGNEDDAIQMFLYDPDPCGQDLSSCFDSDSYEACNKDGLPPHPSFLSEGPTKVLPDEIGEFSVEGRSSSLVWSEVSDKLVGVCCEVFKNSGSFHFYCKHELGITDCWSMEDSTDVNPRSLVRFCSSSGFISVPRALQSVSELDIACNALSKWLKQDRFGLDVEFVQELIEQLPGCQFCSGYEFLNKRGKYSSSLTVGSGRLLSKRKMNTHEEDLASANFFYQGYKKPRKEGSFHTRGRDVHRFPPGKPLSTKLSAELVANILQISEFLWRFYEILGMKEPMSFEELEEELVNPWSDGSTSLEKIEKEIKENKSCTLHEKYDIMDMGFPPKESDQAVPCQSIPTFIEMGSAKEASEARVASRTYHRCTGASLTKVHSSLLNVLVGELQVKVASLVDPNFDSGEMKPRRGRKKDVDTSVTLNKSKIDMLPVNELTWPEMARRYVLSVLSMDCNLESSEITSREGGKVFRCLQGDGGVLCGSLTGVAGMEADALLLAEATKQICGSLRRENEIWPVVEDKDMDAIGACDTAGVNGSGIPEWAQVLEPVRKLPTNVGTRIRKCVYEALDKGPPEWARKILEHSISKEVYKGNASGPTKKAVLSVLANVSSVVPEPKPEKKKKEKGVNTIADIISNQCRSVLRRASAADESRTFCNLLGTTSYIDNDDEGILGSPAMVSRPLDFRTIDLRLAMGYYGGSHEAFLEDVREVWRNIHIAYGDKPELIQMAETLSQNFESLYEKEVLPLVQKYRELVNSDCLAPATKKELIEDFNCASSIPKAPWDEGVCKVCGIDRDDESVLLCDTCDSEYHTYCLIPPLAKIPEGNWYCPACVVGQGKFPEASKRTKVITRRRQKRYQGDYSRSSSEAVNRLATTMGEKEYWDFSVEERINLLKFLCDEVLNSALIREHLEHCAETASDLQPKLRALTAELRNLKFREECLTTRPTKDNMITFDGVSEAVRDKMTTMLANQDKSIGLQQTVNNNLVSTTGSHIQLQDPPVENSHHSLFCTNAISDQHCNGGTTAMKVAGIENEASVIDDSLIPENLVSYGISIRRNENNGTMEQPLSTKEQKFDVMSRELKTQCHMSKKNGFEAANISPVVLSSVQGTFPSGESKQAGYTANGTVPPTKISDLFLGNCFAAQTDLSMPQTPSTEAKSLKNEISLLSESIGRIESQLLKVSLRRELLGRDSAGRLYWVLSRAEKRPWLVVDGSMLVHEKREQNLGKAPLAESSGLCYSSPFCNKLSSTSREFLACSSDRNEPLYSPYRGGKMTPSCVSYDSEAEIQELIRWLRDGDPRERDLSESILQFDKLRSQSNQLAGNVVHVDSQAKSCDGEVIVTPRSLCTKAAAILEKNYGPCLEPETTELPKKRGRKAKVIYGDRMYRCECLEPIWPARNHCLSCHHTFCTNLELEGHNDGRCSSGSPAPDESKESDELSKGKAIMRSEAASACTKEGEVLASDKFEVSSKLTKFQKEEMASPYKVEEISRKFITNDSNRELVREIGLLGSNGIPLFVHTTSPYVHDPTLILDPARKVHDEVSVIPTNTEVHSSHDEANSNHDHISSHSPKSDSVLGKVSVSHGTPGLEAGDCGIVPLSALKPLVGRDSQILRRLKVNLLDIDAALPAEALRPTKANSSTQRSWRAFIKSADSVLDMVKAVIVFEDMIKSEYLRSGWWYWSSLSAAVRTSTISSLALRIYALDSAIIYEKTPADLDGGHLADNLRSSKKRKGNEG